MSIKKGYDKSKKHDFSKELIWHRLPQDRLIVEVSLWSADVTRLADEIRSVDAFADMYHIDVSDGHFVPGFLFFADLVAALRPLTTRPFHVHLMTTNPLAHIADFASAGANLISIHAENGTIVPAALDAIHRMGIATGLVLGLDVPPETIAPYLELVNLVLMMGTPMGVKGVKPSSHIYDRVRKIKSLISQEGLDEQVKVFADGGIREHTVPKLRSAGADGVIAGSIVFKSANLDETFNWLHGLKS
jgi:ribulose-phosphate 3-epimerase